LRINPTSGACGRRCPINFCKPPAYKFGPGNDMCSLRRGLRHRGRACDEATATTAFSCQRQRRQIRPRSFRDKRNGKVLKSCKVSAALTSSGQSGDPSRLLHDLGGKPTVRDRVTTPPSASSADSYTFNRRDGARASRHRQVGERDRQTTTSSWRYGRQCVSNCLTVRAGRAPTSSDD